MDTPGYTAHKKANYSSPFKNDIRASRGKCKKVETWLFLSKCLVRGGELGLDKYLLCSDTLLKRPQLLCDRPLGGKKKNEAVFSQ